MWIEELSNGKFKYVERYTDPYSEKEKKVSITLSSNSNQAKNKASRILNEKIKDKTLTKRETTLTMDELHKLWFEIYRQNVKPQTVDASISIYKRISLELDVDILIKNVTSELIQNFLDEMYYKRNYSFSYIDSMKSLLNTMFKYAKRAGYLEVNVISDVSIFKKNIEKNKGINTKFLEDEELELVLKTISKFSNKNQKNNYADALELISLTGVRYGELAALKESDYVEGSLDINKTLYYNRNGIKNAIATSPKTNASYRKIRLSDRAIEIVENFKSINKINKIINTNYVDNNFLFASSNGYPIHISDLNAKLRQVSKYLTEQKLLDKKLSTHIFRHTHVSQLSAMNLPLKTIMERAGHSSPQTTLSIYTHITKQASDELVFKMNQKNKPIK